MKKLLLSFFLLCSVAAVHAQICTPGAQTSTAKGYILPDSATNLSHGCPGLDYVQIMYIKAPLDTQFAYTVGSTTGQVTANIVSFVIASDIVGLPTYLSTNSVPAPLGAAGASSPKSNFSRLVVKGDSLACVRISGNVPGSTAAGPNNLSIKVRAYLSNLSSTNVVLNALLSAAYPTHKLDTLVSLDYYKIIIDPQPCFPQSVQNLEQFGFHLVGCAPNPFNAQTKIQFETAETKNLEVRILNAVGQVVSQRSIKAQKGQNYITFDASSWKAGLYTCVLSDGQHNQSIKMIMQ